tara:strand:+ start:63 stop:1040 length:978 start_codon:yes stop_codon:yes gene_type:complete
MIKLSIIIPFKNSEKSIIRTLKSIKIQNINSNIYEVLLINDFSNNKTIYKIKKYINDLENFKLYKSKKNTTGPGYARNLGVKYSKGKFILFLDSDDCLKKNCLIKILKKIDVIKSDIYAFGFSIIDQLNNMKRLQRHDLHLMRLDKIEIFKNYFDASIIPQVISNLFSRKFLIKNKIKFKEGYFEDILFFFKSIYYSKLIKTNNDIFYIKYNINNSIVNTISRRHILNHFKAYSDCYNFIAKKKFNNNYKTKLKYFYIKGIIGLTAVYINKVNRSNITKIKKNRLISNIHKIYSKILLASKIKYVYKTDKDKFVKKFFKIIDEKK